MTGVRVIPAAAAAATGSDSDAATDRVEPVSRPAASRPAICRPCITTGLVRSTATSSQRTDQHWCRADNQLSLLQVRVVHCV